MNRRVILALGAVAVLAALLVLFFKLREAGKASANAQSTPATTASTEPATQPPRETPKVVADSNRPGAPVVSPAQGRSDPPDEGVKEVTINGMRIRDHRKGEHAPIDLPPNIHAPDSRKISSTLTAAISEKLQAVMSECAVNVPSEARGPKPKLEGTVTIGIKDHQAKITQSTMQLRDVVGASVDPTKQCIEQKSLGLTTAATDETDLESYTISITFALR